MKSKVGLFSLLVVLTVAYAAFDFWYERHQEDVKNTESLLLNWKPEQISEVLWQQQGQVKIHLIRGPQGWDLVVPFKEAADSEAASTFTEGLVLEKYISLVQEGEGIDLKTFGLDQPKATLLVKNNLNQQVAFQISEKKNFQGDIYLRKDQEKKIYLVSRTWLQKASHEAFDFRDKRLARIAFSDVIGFRLARGSEAFELSKKDAIWSLKGPNEEEKNWRLDQNKVRKILGLFSGGHVTGFLPKPVRNPKNKAMITIQFFLKEQKSWQGEIFQGEGKSQILVSDAFPEAMVVEPSAADELYKASLDSLRDRTEPFQIHKEDARFIEVDKSDKHLVIDLAQDEKSTDKKIQERLSKAKAILNKLNATELAEFKTQATPVKTEQIAFRLLDAGKKEIFKLVVNGPMPSKSNGLDKTVYLGFTNLAAFGFTLDEKDWKNLNIEALLEEPETRTK